MSNYIDIEDGFVFEEFIEEEDEFEDIIETSTEEIDYEEVEDENLFQVHTYYNSTGELNNTTERTPSSVNSDLVRVLRMCYKELQKRQNQLEYILNTHQLKEPDYFSLQHDKWEEEESEIQARVDNGEELTSKLEELVDKMEEWMWDYAFFQIDCEAAMDRELPLRIKKAIDIILEI